MIGCFGRRPKAIEYLSTGRQAELVKSYDGGAAVVFSTCAFPVDISSTSASGKVREYPEWIANQWGGAVPGVCMHRRMASGMHEYIHHASSCHLRYVSVEKDLVKAWLRDEYVLNAEGRGRIREAVAFRQRLRCSQGDDEAPRHECHPGPPPIVMPARPSSYVPAGHDDGDKPDPPENAGASQIGNEWLPPDFDARSTFGGLAGGYGTGEALFERMKGATPVAAGNFDVEDIYQQGAEPKTQFLGVSKQEPDRRGFLPSAVTFHVGVERDKALHEPTSQPAASAPSSSESLPSQVLPLVLTTTHDISERIRSDLGHNVRQCAGCKKELEGKKNRDYFQFHHQLYCKECYEGQQNPPRSPPRSSADGGSASSSQWLCSNANCRKKLQGKRTVDWFRCNNAHWCAECYSSNKCW